eukprot:6182517-Pleurochrysis_carterae.AAC.1
MLHLTALRECHFVETLRSEHRKTAAGMGVCLHQASCLHAPSWRTLARLLPGQRPVSAHACSHKRIHLYEVLRLSYLCSIMRRSARAPTGSLQLTAATNDGGEEWTVSASRTRKVASSTMLEKYALRFTYLFLHLLPYPLFMPKRQFTYCSRPWHCPWHARSLFHLKRRAVFCIRAFCVVLNVAVGRTVLRFDARLSHFMQYVNVSRKICVTGPSCALTFSVIRRGRGRATTVALWSWWSAASLCARCEIFGRSQCRIQSTSSSSAARRFLRTNLPYARLACVKRSVSAAIYPHHAFVADSVCRRHADRHAADDRRRAGGEHGHSG